MKKKIGGILICMLILGAGITIIQASKPTNEVALAEPIIRSDYADQQQLVFNCPGVLYASEGEWTNPINSEHSRAQSFTPMCPILTRIKLSLWKTSYFQPNYDLKVSIRKHLDEQDLVSKILHPTQIPNEGDRPETLTEIDFSDIVVRQGERYYIVLEAVNLPENVSGDYLIGLNINYRDDEHPNNDVGAYPNGIMYIKSIYEYDNVWVDFSLGTSLATADFKFITFGH